MTFVATAPWFLRVNILIRFRLLQIYFVLFGFFRKKNYSLFSLQTLCICLFITMAGRMVSAEPAPYPAGPDIFLHIFAICARARARESFTQFTSVDHPPPGKFLYPLLVRNKKVCFLFKPIQYNSMVMNFKYFIESWQHLLYSDFRLNKSKHFECVDFPYKL